MSSFLKELCRSFLPPGKSFLASFHPQPLQQAKLSPFHPLPSLRPSPCLAYRKCYLSSLASCVEGDLPVETAPPIDAKPRPMQPKSVRTGAIAVKCGMTAVWDKWGARLPITVLWFDDNIVTQVKVLGKDCTTALQIGAGQKKAKQLTKPMRGHFQKHNVPLKRKLAEFPVTEDALLPVGTPITVRHFVPGQYVDIAGTSIGKGFQGAMKRWGFAGMPASHGASLSHRSLGSTGGRQDPGKVFKGKKMAGRMGGKRRTVKSVWIYKIEPERGLMWVRGQVPGHSGNFVFVKDAFQKRPDPSITPFPTHFAPLDEDLSALEPMVADFGDSDPFMAGD